jgi:hypothetical protein
MIKYFSHDRLKRGSSLFIFVLSLSLFFLSIYTLNIMDIFERGEFKENFFKERKAVSQVTSEMLGNKGLSYL